MKKLIISIIFFLLIIGVNGQILNTASFYVAQPAEDGGFPVINDSITGFSNGSVQNRSITLNSGIQVGELLLVLFYHDSSSETATINTGVSGNNWNIEYSNYDRQGTTMVIWKIAEGSDTLRMTTSGFEKSNWASFRITGYNASNPLTVTEANGASTNGDPPSNTGEDGESDYLWMIALRTGTGTIVASDRDGNFSTLTTSNPADASNEGLSYATRKYNISTAYDPAAFTSSYGDWGAQTIIINPN